MDNFLRRLKYYGIGFGIGLVFVIVLFRQKGCSWTPGNRVKSAILERIVFTDSLDEAFLSQHKITPKILREFIENGTISFMKSKRDGNEKRYHFHGILGSKSLDCIIAFREKSAVVDIDFLHDDVKNYVRLKGNARPFLYKEKNWFSGKWADYNFAEFSKSDAPEKFTKAFLKNGVMVSAASTYDNVKPNTFLKVISLDAKGGTIEYCVNTAWFQEKMEIMEIKLCKPE
ncbi:MAG: hypothetical protein EBS34_12280 [Flavobacteriales bacterium]|nr:hypothetical protein [Flavobacteriales bacterium]